MDKQLNKTLRLNRDLQNQVNTLQRLLLSVIDRRESFSNVAVMYGNLLRNQDMSKNPVQEENEEEDEMRCHFKLVMKELLENSVERALKMMNAKKRLLENSEERESLKKRRMNDVSLYQGSDSECI